MRNGPGLLVTWSSATEALAYVVLKARHPSLSFYPLVPSCCPLLPDGQLPCCPLAATITSVQVNDLAAGAGYRFKLVKITALGNLTDGPTATMTVATVATAPGLPSVWWSSPGIAEVSWAVPISDGGDDIRGYRLWANASTSFHVANTSSRSAGAQLALLPSLPFTIAVSALNSVGASDPSSVTTVAASLDPPSLEYELSVGGWARGSLSRGGYARHRVYLSSATEAASFHLHTGAATQTDAPGQPPALHLARDAEPALPRVDSQLAVESLRSGLWSNTSGKDGEVSLRLQQPIAGWYYLVIHSMAAATPRTEYDLRVATQSGALAAALATGTLPQFEQRSATYRYRIDPEGLTNLPEPVIAHYLAPI